MAITHRAEREAQILAALAAGPAAIPDLVTAVYPELGAALRLAAGRNVLAHLLALSERGVVQADGPRSAAAAFRLAPPGQAGGHPSVATPRR
jgi:hypothetical protein